MALFDTTFAPYVPFGSRNLSLALGSSGTDVAVLQAVYDLMLKTMNPPGGPMGSPIPITGTFNSATRQAVMNIQSYFGLSVDGVVGPNTFFIFGQGVGPNTTYGGPVYGSRSLAEGDSGGDVTILQNRLNCFRYANNIGHPANGVFDPATASAVLAFKLDAAANGDTGFPSNAIAGSGFYDATWIYTFAGGRGIFTGRNGFDVVFVQVVLKNLGFYAGRITGYYDAATRSAVIAFQTSEGISADGVVGQQTFYHIGLNNLVPAPRPLGIAWPPTVPPPEVTVCSTALTTQSSDLHPYGEASLVINENEGFESLDVVGNNLPDPGTFGSQFVHYVFVLSLIGGVVARRTMSRSLNLAQDDWMGTYSPGVKTIPKGIVTIFPATTSAPDGPFGPAVVAGDLSTCH